MKKQFPSSSFLRLSLTTLALILCPSVYALDVNVAPSGDIQAAIDRVAASGGGTVNIGAGQGLLRSTLKIKSHVTLNGAGTPQTTLTIGGNFSGIQNATEGLTHVTIQNLKLAGTGEKTSNQCNGIIIASLKTYHTAIKLNNVQVLNCGGMGVHIKRADGVNITNCSFHHNGGFTLMHNFYIRESRNATLANSRMTESPSGTGLHVAGVCTNIHIINNVFANNGSQGINVQDSPTGIIIQGNTCTGNGTSDSYRSDGIAFTGTHALIENNTSNNNVGFGIHTWNGSGVLNNNRASGNKKANYNIHGTFTQQNNQ